MLIKRIENKLRAFSLGVALSMCSPALLSAAEVMGKPVAVNIEAGTLKASLDKLAAQTAQSIIYKAADLNSINAEALKGNYSPLEALKKLVADNKLKITKTGEKTFVVSSLKESSSITPNASAIPEKESLPEENFVVTATRTDESLRSLASSVTVLTAEDLEEAAKVNSDLGSILGKRVPGLGTSTQSLSNSGQSLRGRNFSVLINGVPQSSPLRNVLRDLRTIDVAAIERIEIVRGATAIHGNGATGGIINIITKQNKDEDGLNGTSSIGTTFSTEDFNDGWSYRTSHQINGSTGGFDYLFNVSYQQKGGLFDANGDRIPSNPQFQGGLDESEDTNFLGRVSYDFTDTQRLTLGVNHYNYEQDSPYLATAGSIADKRFAQAVKSDVPGDNPETTNTSFDLSYEDDDFFGSQLYSQFFFQDYEAVFPWDTNPTYGMLFPTVGGAQTTTESRKVGGRFQMTTPVEFNEDLTIDFTYGVDFVQDTTEHDLNDRAFSPEMTQDAWGLFLQAETTLWDKLTVRGGVRHEDITVDADSFRPLAYDLFMIPDGFDVDGGELDYSETLFNLGLTYEINQTYEAFVSFSQGFSVTDIGGALRGITPLDGVTTVEQFDPEAQKVDNYEIGARAHWDSVEASLSFFYSESDLGGSFTGAPNFEIVRAPEDIYGIEGTIDWAVDDAWTLGGTLTWQEGRTEGDDGGNEDIGSDRIAPLKLTAYVEHQTNKDWRNRLEFLYSGNRDVFDLAPNTPNSQGQGEVDSFFTVDLISSYDICEKSTISLGVENLFNEEYSPVISQAFNNDLTYTGAQGRTITLTYSLKW